MSIKILETITNFKKNNATHKTLMAVSECGRYRMTAEKCPAGIQFEICDENAPSTASTDVVYYGSNFSKALATLTEMAA